MEVYEHINRWVAELLGILSQDAEHRVLREAPAAAARFWETEAVQYGLGWAHVAAAMLTALFSFIIVTSILKKRALVLEAAPPGAGVLPEAKPVASPIGERWQEVVGHLSSPREGDWKLAVIEADKLIDDALRRAGFAGDTFGDRLTNMQPGALQSLDGIWWAHRIRNRLAHEVDYFLRYTEAKQAIAYYEQALNELELL